MNDLRITRNFLEQRSKRAVDSGYPKPKWIEFCEIMLDRGFEVYLYESRSTVSKYVTVRAGRKSYRVRFSNHKPNYLRETRQDCDFFVGVNHLGVWTTGQAIDATIKYFSANKSSIEFSVSKNPVTS